MPGGRAGRLDELPQRIASFLEEERRGVMTTIASDGSAHSVPVVFARIGDEIVSPIDHKPKTGDVMARVKNLARDDRVTLLVDHWDEDWTQVGWVMVRGRGEVNPDADMSRMKALNERYPQYAPDERHDALITIRPERLLWWAWTDPA
jgi:PPOX class probable F420-dependent enzyme